MDSEKQDKPLFKLDEKRLEKFLKKMPEELKKEIKNFSLREWFAMIAIIVISCSERPECDDKEE